MKEILASKMFSMVIAAIAIPLTGCVQARAARHHIDPAGGAEHNLSQCQHHLAELPGAFGWSWKQLLLRERAGAARHYFYPITEEV